MRPAAEVSLFFYSLHHSSHGGYSLVALLLHALPLAHGLLTVNNHLVGIVDNAVADGVCQDRIANLLSPPGYCELRAEDRRRVFDLLVVFTLSRVTTFYRQKMHCTTSATRVYSAADEGVQFPATALFNWSGRGVQPRAPYSIPASSPQVAVSFDAYVDASILRTKIIPQVKYPVKANGGSHF